MLLTEASEEQVVDTELVEEVMPVEGTVLPLLSKRMVLEDSTEDIETQLVVLTVGELYTDRAVKCLVVSTEKSAEPYSEELVPVVGAELEYSEIDEHVADPLLPGGVYAALDNIRVVDILHSVEEVVDLRYPLLIKGG